MAHWREITLVSLSEGGGEPPPNSGPSCQYGGVRFLEGYGPTRERGGPSFLLLFSRDLRLFSSHSCAIYFRYALDVWAVDAVLLGIFEEKGTSVAFCKLKLMGHL